MLHLSILAGDHTHTHGARLRSVFIFRCLIRGWYSKGQVNRRDKTGRDVVNLLGLLDVQFNHSVFAVPGVVYLKGRIAPLVNPLLKELGQTTPRHFLKGTREISRDHLALTVAFKIRFDRTTKGCLAQLMT